MVDFGDEYKNIVSFQLTNIKFPNINNLINEYNNDILITIDDEDINDQIEHGIYDLTKLIENINTNEKIFNNFEIKLENDHVSIKSNDDKIFNLINRDKSIFKKLGFTQNKYIGKNYYASDELPFINRSRLIHLFIEGIDDEKPILSFNSLEDPNKLCPKNINFSKPLEILGEIFIKFKYDLDLESNNLIDFYGDPHELSFRVGVI